VDQVLDALSNSKSVKTINGLNIHVEVGAGGFAGATNPSFVYTVIDRPNYLVLNFDTPPPLKKSAALFEAVGRIDPELFETDSSGYTQFGRAYLSLQSFVPDSQFIAGYVQAAAQFGRIHADRRGSRVAVQWRRCVPW